MPSIEVEIEVFCTGCGQGICNSTHVGKTRGRGQQYFDVEPCTKCIEQAREEGKDEGYDSGYSQGKSDALNDTPK